MNSKNRYLDKKNLLFNLKISKCFGMKAYFDLEINKYINRERERESKRKMRRKQT